MYLYSVCSREFMFAFVTNLRVWDIQAWLEGEEKTWISVKAIMARVLPNQILSKHLQTGG